MKSAWKIAVLGMALLLTGIWVGPCLTGLVGVNSRTSQGSVDRVGGSSNLIRTNLQTGTSYTATLGDGGSLIMFNGSQQNTLNLPSPSEVPDGWHVFVHNAGNGTMFLVPAAGTVEGVTSWPLYTDEGVLLVSTGRSRFSYHAVRGTETNGRSNTPGAAVNIQHGASYAIGQSDRNTVLVLSNDESSATVTLPKPGVDYPNGWHFYVKNIGPRAATLTPTAATIDGLASLSLSTQQATFVVSDGSNYFTVPGGTATVANASGTPQSGSHWLFGSCRLGLNCSITLSGSAVFTNASSYVCTAVNQTAASPVRVTQTSGTGFVITGNGTDVVGYSCVGN